ncbi:hypothetical protein P1P75_01035 [Streptomyces sp. ID05-39B]|uniref:phage tail protein n=1 Tax=Streptomyces sp. ID05-39B TaxID=3028664 RepID=UPI0029A161C3|nr:hypothetical protein [Streptomyces sp. ID05-39B]MDX3525073.1 hypothetical protein [Streptomyces sp. ID05-39B]
MSAGQVVGRVSVRVLPDTSDFRRQAEKQLDRIEKQLKPIAIHTRLDMTGFTRDMIKQIREINRVNRTSDSRKIRFQTMLSTAGMVQEVKKAVRALQARADTGDRIEFKTQLSTVDVDLKISDQSLRDMTDQLKDWRDRNSPLKIQIEPDVAAAASAATSARLGLLTRPRTVSIIPTLNDAAVAKVAASLAALSGMRVVNNMFEKFGNILKNLDKNVPIIGTIATAIAGLSAWGLAAASNLFALSASLAQIGAVSLTLPGLLGGFAVGIGVTVAALRDFNKEVPEFKAALSQMQNQISANFWEQARQPIRDLVDNLLPRFAEGFRSSSTAIGKFFGAFATDLTSALDPGLVDKMFGYLNESITTATGGTKTFASIIAQLGEVGASYLPNLAGWFVNISKEFDAWLKKKGEIGLKKEIDEGIQSLKDLGGILFETGGIFAGLSRAANEAGGSSLGMLRQTLKDIHATVDSPGFQAGLVDVFKAAHQAMSNLSKQAGPAVKNLFIELGKLLTTVLPMAGTIIGTVMGAISGALSQPIVTSGITTVFAGLLTAVQILAPAMAPLGQALGALMQVVAAMLPAFAALVSAAILPLAGAFSQLAPMIIPIVRLLAGELTSAFEMLAPLIQQMVPIVGQLLGTAFQVLAQILPVVSQLLGKVFKILGPIVAQLAGALGPILASIGGYITQVMAAAMPLVELGLKIIASVLKPLIPMVQEVITKYMPKLADAFTRVYAALQPFLEALLALVNFLMPILVPVLGFIIDILAVSLVAAVNGVALVFEGLREIFVGVFDYLSGWFKLWWGLFKGIWDQDWTIFQEGWSQLWDGVWGIVKGVWDTIVGALAVFLNIGILGAAGKAMSGLKSLFTSAWKAITDLFTGAFAAIRGYVTLFFTGAKTLVDDGMKAIGRFFSAGWTAITSYIRVFFTGAKQLVIDGIKAIGKFFSDGWSAIRTTASSGLSSLVSTVSTWIGKAAAKVGELPGMAKSALSSIGSALRSAGMDLIRGFIEGIKAKASDVASAAMDVAKKAVDGVKGFLGIHSPSRVFATLGDFTMQGFLKGLESNYDTVRKSLRGLASEIASTDFALPDIGTVSASSGVAYAVNAALDGSAAAGTTKVLNYYAAPGSSLGSEEDLFDASNRARFGW